MMLYPGSVGSQTYVADVRVRYVLMVSGSSTYILTTVAVVAVNTSQIAMQSSYVPIPKLKCITITDS